MYMTQETTEKMRGAMIRMKDKHRVMLKRLAKKFNKGEAEWVREMIEKAFMKEL